MPDMTTGVVTALSPLVRRIVCNNPSVMTGPGTNTYLVGTDEIVVIDPGPEDEGHLDAVAAAAGDKARWIVVTHTHSDHSPGAESLRGRLGPGVRVLGFDGRDDFVPDADMRDGNVITAEDFELRALYTPGHASNHLCFLLEAERLLFSGDHIMNGSTVIIPPPDGDMAHYLESLQRVRRLELAAIAPGHGDLITDPVAKIDEYVAHRLAREAAVAEALATAGPTTVEKLVPVVYADVSDTLYPIARMSLWAHLRKLAGDGRATAGDTEDLETTWESLGA